MLLTHDGTTSANAVKLWVDGVNVGSLTAGAAATNPKTVNKTDILSIGGISGAANSNYLLNEFVVWNEVIDPTGIYVGAARAAFVDCTAYDGTAAAGETKKGLSSSFG